MKKILIFYFLLILAMCSCFMFTAINIKEMKSELNEIQVKVESNAIRIAELDERVSALEEMIGGEYGNVQ